MDLLKKEGIELGKVYTDKTMPPFKVEEGKVNNSKVTQSFTRAVAAIRKISRKLNDDDNYAFIQKLEKWLR